MGTDVKTATAASRFDRWVDRTYVRTRRWYAWLLVTATVGSIHLVLLPLFVALFAPLVTTDVSLWPTLLAIEEIATLAGLPTLVWVVWVHHGSLVRYVRDEAVDPAELWRTSVAELPKGVLQGLIGYAIPLAAGLAYFAQNQALSLLHLAILEVGLLCMVAGVGVFLFLFWEIALRPVVREIAPELPDDLVGREPGVSLATKVLLLLLSTCLFNGVAVGAASSWPLGAEAKAAAVVGSTVVLSATLAGLLVLMVRHSFVSRIDDLRLVLERVRGGSGLGVRLPPLAGDDLDQVGQAFNEMVDRLGRYDAEMRASRARIVAASDAERRRVERNIHDGAQQRLVALALELRMLEGRLRAASSPGKETSANELQEALADAREAVDAAGGNLSEALGELRELARGLHPQILSTDGLRPALEQLAARGSVPVKVRAPEGRYPEAIESTVYFVVSEALANIGKYAQASTAEVSVERRGGGLQVRVEDDGVGGADLHSGSGLSGLRDRVAALDGTLIVESRPGHGTVVRAELPLPADRDDASPEGVLSTAGAT